MPRPVAENPAGSIVLLTHSDTTDFPTKPRGIIPKTDGTVVFVNEDDTETTIPAAILGIGVLYPLSPKRINATGTTATFYGVY